MVSYSNTIPFQFGIEHFYNELNIELLLDVPSMCSQRLINEEVDLALVPVGSLPLIPNYHLVGDYCIGAENHVKTVLLLSQVPLHEITNVWLDNESQTSVNLVKILAKEYWKMNWSFLPIVQNTNNLESAVLIGDKAIRAASSYKYSYDLASAWNSLTGLPFVFAVWASKVKIEDVFLQKLQNAFQFGLNNIPLAIESLGSKYNTLDLYDYLNHCISFKMDENKRKALKLYLDYIAKL